MRATCPAAPPARGYKKGRLRADTTPGRLYDDYTTTDCTTIYVATVPVQCSCATLLCANCPVALALAHLVHCVVSINTVFLLDPVR